MTEEQHDEDRKHKESDSHEEESENFAEKYADKEQHKRDLKYLVKKRKYGITR